MLSGGGWGWGIVEYNALHDFSLVASVVRTALSYVGIKLFNCLTMLRLTKCKGILVSSQFFLTAPLNEEYGLWQKLFNLIHNRQFIKAPNQTAGQTYFV